MTTRSYAWNAAELAFFEAGEEPLPQLCDPRGPTLGSLLWVFMFLVVSALALACNDQQISPCLAEGAFKLPEADAFVVSSGAELLVEASGTCVTSLAVEHEDVVDASSAVQADLRCEGEYTITCSAWIPLETAAACPGGTAWTALRLYDVSWTSGSERRTLLDEVGCPFRLEG